MGSMDRQIVVITTSVPYETIGTLSVFPQFARKQASYHARLEEGQS